jgi:hypothetical protein
LLLGRVLAGLAKTHPMAGEPHTDETYSKGKPLPLRGIQSGFWAESSAAAGIVSFFHFPQSCI